MSFSFRGRINRGAYESPHSGVGVEFEPLGVKPDRTGLILHEAGYIRENKDWNFPSTLSPFWRLYYNTRHGHSILFGNRRIDLGPEGIVLIPDHQLFHSFGDQATPAFWLTFSTVDRLSLAQELPVILPPTPVELGLIREASDEIERDVAWEPRERIRRLSLALLHVVLSRPDLHWRDKLPERLEQLMVYIAEHDHVKLSNAELARQAGVSVEGLNRLFKKHLGITPGVYAMQVRIRTASQLLRQTDDSIEAIAEALSFPDRFYFSRVFKRVTGVSPAAYRKKYQ